MTHALYLSFWDKRNLHTEHLYVTQYVFLFRNIQWGPIFVTSFAEYGPNFFAFSSRRDFPLHHGEELKLLR